MEQRNEIDLTVYTLQWGKFSNSKRLFNQNLEGWDFSSTTALDGMFNGAISFTHLMSGGWTQTSQVTTTACMFKGADRFNGNALGLDTSRVRDMNMMLHNAQAFQGVGLGAWDVSLVQRFDRGRFL